MNKEKLIHSYTKDFEVKKEDIYKCIHQVSENKGKSTDYVADSIIQYIEMLSSTCIGQASHKGMKLKPYQKLAVKHMIQNRGMIAAFDVGTGKCLHPDTELLMWNGNIKKAKEIVQGDLLTGDNSSPRTVLSTCKGEETMYKITQGEGDEYIVNESHILTLKLTGHKRYWWSEKSNSYETMYLDRNTKSLIKTKNFFVGNDSSCTRETVERECVDFLSKIDDDNVIDINVVDYLNLPEITQKELKGFKVGVNYPKTKLKIDPYILGLWLGNDSKDFSTITNIDHEILDNLKDWYDEKRCRLTSRKHDNITCKITDDFYSSLKNMNLLGNKHIPVDYLVNSRENRLKLLAGLIDIDGYFSNNKSCYEITQRSKILSKNICQLARSLGFYCSIKEVENPRFNDNNSQKYGLYYRVWIYGNNLNEIPCILDRKKCDQRLQEKDFLVTEIKIEKLECGEYCGFTLDGNGRFLLEDFTVTHNTLTAVITASCILNMAEFLSKEIKVIVITPTSLQKNFKKEMESVGLNPEDTRYHFYTTAKFANDYNKDKIDCSKSLFIVDEAHVFRTDFLNQKYKKPRINKSRAQCAILCASKAWKVLLLTATPIYNQPCDIQNLASMVKGVYPPFKEDPYNLIKSNNIKRFNEQYGNIFLFQESNKDDFPERKDVLVKVVMTPSYYKEYEALEKLLYEKFETDMNEDDEKPNNSFMIALRIASNNLDACIKCDYAIEIIKKGLKTIFFSEFKDSGTRLIMDRLNKSDIGYYLITGSTTQSQRNKIVEEYNSDEGYKLLIITKAGGEGLDLKEVRNVIIFEKSWNVSTEEQVIGRAIRYKSHAFLPKKEQNVTVYHFVTVKPFGINFDSAIPYVKNIKYAKTELVNKKYAYKKQKKDFKDLKQVNEDYGADVYMLVQSLQKKYYSDIVKKHLISISLKSKERFDDHANFDIEFIKKYIGDDWEDLSENPSITPEFVEKHMDKPWNWESLSENPSITPEFVEKHMDKPWNWKGLSENPSITPEFIEKHMDKEWNWEALSGNPSITPEFIDKHLDKEWWWDCISGNPSITPEFIEKNLDKEWDWSWLSENPSITPEFIEKYIDKPWDWRELSYNPSITPEFIEKYIDKPWNWESLSRNPSITPEFVEKHFDKPWDRDQICINPSFTPDFFEKHLYRGWNWYLLSSNLSITPEFVEKYIDDKPFDWDKLSLNRSMTPEFFERHINEVNWDYLSLNPSITLEFIEKHIDNKYWNWYYLSINPAITTEFVEKHINRPWKFGDIFRTYKFKM